MQSKPQERIVCLSREDQSCPVRYMYTFNKHVMHIVIKRICNKENMQKTHENRQHCNQNALHIFYHDDATKWKYFPRYWPFVRSPVYSPHKGQWRGALMFSLICVCKNSWVNNGDAGDFKTPLCSLWRHCNAAWWYIMLLYSISMSYYSVHTFQIASLKQAIALDSYLAVWLTSK